MTLPGAAATAGILTIGVVRSGKTSARMYPFAKPIIGRPRGRTKDDILNQPIDARRSVETRRIHDNRERPHRGYISLEPFRMAGKTGCGKACRCAT